MQHDNNNDGERLTEINLKRDQQLIERVCNFWLAPTQQRRHQNVLQDLTVAIYGLHQHNSEATKTSCWICNFQFPAWTDTTAKPPKLPAGFANTIDAHHKATKTFDVTNKT